MTRHLRQIKARDAKKAREKRIAAAKRAERDRAKR